MHDKILKIFDEELAKFRKQKNRSTKEVMKLRIRIGEKILKIKQEKDNG